jgi:glycerate-2-kinase
MNQESHSASRIAREIYVEALEVIRADRLVYNALTRSGDILHLGAQTFDLRCFRNIYVVGAGKAGTGMAQAVEERLGDLLAEGVVVTKHGHAGPTRKIHLMEAGHPIPDDDSLRAGEAIYQLASRAGAEDLLLCLISGGASALMELPREGVSLPDLQATTGALMRAGATINELNTVRACLSRLKAGGLARAAAPARAVCLVLSDVLGNPLEVIGSGPCVEIGVDPAQARAVLERYGVWERIPDSVRALVERLARETAAVENPSFSLPKEHAPYHYIIGDIWTALTAAREAAIRRGLRPAILTGMLQGEAREAGKVCAAIARDLPRTAPHTGLDCYLLGGETTVTVRGEGKGGRSQEIACVASAMLSGVEGVTLLAGGTDGTDGPTDAAGGWADSQTLSRARSRGWTPDAALKTSDSYAYLQAAESLLITGPTHSNVGDLVVMVYRP